MAFIDARTLPDGERLKADICIAGAGAAGITLARELTGAGLSVIIVESGGFELEGDTQFLYHGTNSGARYFDLASCRLRYFGGSTNHWGAYCGVNAPIDFDRSQDAGAPAWPVSLKTLRPYYLQAADMLGLNLDHLDPHIKATAIGVDHEVLIESQAKDMQTRINLRTDKRFFGEIWRAEIAAMEDVRVFLNLNLVHLQMDEAGRQLKAFRTKTLEGKEITIEADRFVLACHAIENARLLLHANDVQTRGIGNSSDQVGRNFMDHMVVRSGLFHAANGRVPIIYSNDDRTRYRVDYDMNIAVSDEAAIRQRIMQYYCDFAPVYDNDKIYSSARGLSNGFMKPFDMRLLSDLGTVLSNLPDAVKVTRDHLGMQGSVPLYYELAHRVEQAPNPDSRVTLTGDRDALGMQKVDLHWDFSELDVRTLNQGQATLVQRVSATGMGRFAVEPITLEQMREQASGYWHHMGTTRMSETERTGVVDKDLRVHETGNLYVAGSSVFPTGGAAGPTLTIIAMTMRLAEHLKAIGQS